MQMMKPSNANRGQAIVETAIFMPIFLICLFALIWSVQMSTLSERAQMGVRYGAQITQRNQPYLSYSLFSIYATIDGAPPLTQGACSPSDTSGMTSGRASFFNMNGVVSNTCNGSVFAFSNEGLSNLVILQNSYLNLSVAGPAPNYLLANGNGSLGNTTVASQNFFRSPDLQTLTCRTEVGGLVKASIEGFYDQSAVNLVIPSAFPHIPSPAKLVSQPCVSFSSQPAPFLSTPVPPQPQYTPAAGSLNIPTPTPTKTPISPTPVPVSAGGPTPTPAPLPTATSIPTPATSPGNVS